jgi:hypothetical protein
MKDAVFWDVTPCVSCINGTFGETCRRHLHVRKCFFAVWFNLLVTSDVVPDSVIFPSVMMEATSSSEIGFNKVTRFHIPEGSIRQNVFSRKVGAWK